MAKPVSLSLRNFAQIACADLSFGDLSVLVGAQGTGKSLALQWLKVAMDGKHIIAALRDAGHDPRGREMIIDLILGAFTCARPPSLMAPAMSSTSASATASQLPNRPTSRSKARRELASEVFWERMVITSSERGSRCGFHRMGPYACASRPPICSTFKGLTLRPGP